MVKIKEFIKSRIDIVRSFFAANPQRAKFIGIIAIAIILPLTVGVALTIQNLSQHASQGVGVEIVDKDGIPISTTTDPNVFLKISLPREWVIVPSSPQSNPTIYTIPTSYTVTSAPSINILKFIKIENKNADKSTNGSLTTTIRIKNDSDIAHIPWKLNGLLPEKTQASRTIQVTLIGDSATASFMATIDLRKSTSTSTATLSRVELSLINCSSQLVIKQRCQMSAQAYDTAEQPIAKGVTYMWRISSAGKAASIGTLSQTNSNTSTLYAQNVGTGDVQVVAKVGSALVRKVITFSVTNIISPSPSSSSSTNNSNTSVPAPKPKTSSFLTFDLNRDGVINCKDSRIISLQFGKKGTNLSGDLNRDGVVNGTDYNTILKSYTPGDKTQCK